MNYLKTILISATIVLASPISRAGKAPANVMAIGSDNLTTDNLIPPESFEVDTHKLLEDWYLKNYIQLDKNADKRASKSYSDQDYIDRLQSLHNVIEMPYNKVVRAYIDMYVERKKSLVETMLGMSLYYMPIFEQALDRNGLPLELKYLPVIESALNPNAVSRAGATGIWQFMMATAKGEGLEVNSLVDQRRDPYKSSEAAARYLKKLYNTYGDWSLVIAAYNCGPGNVNKAMRRAGGGKKDFWQIYQYLPAETRSYVPAFIAANYAMNFYNYHNISPALAKRPIITDSVVVNRRVHFQQISDVLGIPMNELRILNPQYRQDLIPGDIRPYSLVLPNNQAYIYAGNEDSIVNHNAELYARRSVVEPSTGRQSHDGDVAQSDDNKNDGEYVTETIVKYHTVGRGENLASIARKYGVSASSIKASNHLRRNRVSRGQTLRITTTRSKWVPAKKDDKPTDAQVAANNGQQNGGSDVPPPSSAKPKSQTHTEVPPRADVKKDNKTQTSQKQESPKKDNGKKDNKKNKKETKPKTVEHKVTKGENLYKIAQKYGVSVDDIKKANNMRSDNIREGQEIKVPGKAGKSSLNTQKAKSSKSSKSSKSKKKGKKNRH